MMRDPFFTTTEPEKDLEACLAGLDWMRSIFPRTEIKEEDKLLWIYLASHCITLRSEYCLFSYQQLSNVMGWKVEAIYRSLLRMRLWGFLNSDISFLRGEGVTLAAALIERKLSPTLPEHEQPKKREITINLMKKIRVTQGAL